MANSQPYNKELSAKQTRTVEIVIDGTPHRVTVKHTPLATKAALVDKARAKVLEGQDGHFDRGEVLTS